MPAARKGLRKPRKARVTPIPPTENRSEEIRHYGSVRILAHISNARNPLQVVGHQHNVRLFYWKTFAASRRERPSSSAI